MEKKRHEIFNNYMLNFKSKFSQSQKMMNQDMYETDNSKILEIINKNLDNLARAKDQDYDDISHLNNTVVNMEHNMSVDYNLSNTFKSNDFYIRKKVKNAHGSLSNSNILSISKL
jgi:hypothetical protein